MSVRDLLIRSRSYRRFHEDRALDEKTLVELVDMARFCPSAANQQPLKYLVRCTPEQNATIFPHLRWAAALPDWPGPAVGERPAGYIVILGDVGIAARFGWDCGIAAQSIMLAAAEQGFGGCMIAAIDQTGLRQALQLPKHLEVVLVLALGYPSETVVLEDGTGPEERPYWRDKEGVHHVPKRPLAEVLVRL
jgi:nitroreductase